MNKKSLQPDFQFAKEVETSGPFQTEACFQCRKCTNGCPVTFAMDLYPDEVVRMVLLGQRQKVLGCQTIWVCAACATCTTRCPNEVRIAELMDCLKEMALEANITCPEPQILTLHESFLKNVQKRGRVFEATFLPGYLLRSGELIRKWQDGTWGDQAKVAWRMLSKGRMPLWPQRIKTRKLVRQMIAREERKIGK